MSTPTSDRAREAATRPSAVASGGDWLPPRTLTFTNNELEVRAATLPKFRFSVVPAVKPLTVVDGGTGNDKITFSGPFVTFVTVAVNGATCPGPTGSDAVVSA